MTITDVIHEVNTIEELALLNFDAQLYENGQSPAYYLFTGRNGAWVYNHDDLTCFFCRHPNAKDDFLIFLSSQDLALDGAKVAALTELIQYLSKDTDRIQLARIPQASSASLAELMQPALRPLGLDCAVIDEDRLDWYYPTHVYDTHYVGKGKVNWKRKRFRNGLSKARLYDITVSLLNRRMFDDIKQLIFNWATERDVEDIQEHIDPYEKILSLWRAPENNLDGIALYNNEAICAFAIWEKVSETDALLHVSISNIAFEGISYFLIRQCCVVLDSQGIKRLNLGGSETEGLNLFKRSFGKNLERDLVTIDIKKAS